jgi:hypothetical protein
MQHLFEDIVGEPAMNAPDCGGDASPGRGGNAPEQAHAVAFVERSEVQYPQDESQDNAHRAYILHMQLALLANGGSSAATAALRATQLRATDLAAIVC